MNHAILIVVDGCRPDALSATNTPNIHGLMERGAYTLAARTVPPALTLPVHFSIFTGTAPSDHGVLANAGPAAPGAWGLIDLVRCNGGTAAVFFSWEELRNLYRPCAVEMAVCRNTPEEADHDLRVAEACADWVTERRPNFVFLYLERTDHVGHEAGWMSDPYRAAVRTADEAVGGFLARLAEAGLRDRYGIVLQSDHGGIGRDHGGLDAPEVLTVPWIASGPGIRSGHRLVSEVTVLDTAPALARMLGIRPHFQWRSRGPEEAWEGGNGPVRAAPAILSQKRV